MERDKNRIAIFLDNEPVISKETPSNNGSFLTSRNPSATFITEKFGKVEVNTRYILDVPGIVTISSDAFRSRTSKSIERGLPVAKGFRVVYVNGYLNGSQDIGADPKNGNIQRLRVEGY